MLYNLVIDTPSIIFNFVFSRNPLFLDGFIIKHDLFFIYSQNFSLF